MKKLLISLLFFGGMYPSDETTMPSVNRPEELKFAVKNIVKNSFPDDSEELLLRKLNFLAGEILRNTQFFDIGFLTSATNDRELFLVRNTAKFVAYIIDGHCDRIQRESESKKSEMDFDRYLGYINSISEQVKNNLKSLPPLGKVWTNDEWDKAVASAQPSNATLMTQEELETTFSEEQLEELSQESLSLRIADDITSKSFPHRNITERSTEELTEEMVYLQQNIIICSQGMHELIQKKSPEFNHPNFLFHSKNRCELMVYILDAYVERIKHMKAQTPELEQQLQYAKEVVCQIRENLNALNHLS